MKNAKLLIGGLLFFAMSYLYLANLDSFINNENHIFKHDETKELIYSFIFSVIGIVTIKLYPEKEITKKELSMLVVSTGVLFFLQISSLIWITNFQISPTIISKFDLSFKSNVV